MLPFLRWSVTVALLCFATLGAQAATASPAAALQLTSAEKDWLAAHPVIRVGYDPDFRPFCFRDADGRARGIDADLLALLEQRLGVKFELRSGASWSEVYAGAVRRQVDILSSTADLPERRQHFAFTREYVKFPVTIVTRTDGPFAVTHSDLRSMRIAAVRDYAATLAFRRAYPGIEIHETASIEDALTAVARKEADATVTNLTNASYVIKTRGFSSLKIAGVLPEVFELRMAVRSDWPELHAILDRALGSIAPEEMATILDRWVKVDYAQVIRWDVVRRWTIVGTIFAVTVIALVTWRNRSLARELAKRLVVQQELEATNLRVNLVNTELERRHAELGELMRVAAHDLRSPLTAIMLHTELAREVPDQPIDLRPISWATRQMMQLINDLLDVHALEEGQRKFHEEDVEVSELVHTAATALTALAQRKEITLDIGGLRPVSLVRVDPGALRQVIDNLLSNALKFSVPGCRVTLISTEWNDYTRIEVRDQGPGVAATERERIFTKYARGTARPTGGEKSTGLGLAIVRDLVAAMNGRVWCENRTGGGAVFVVVLPKATRVV